MHALPLLSMAIATILFFFGMYFALKKSDRSLVITPQPKTIDGKRVVPLAAVTAVRVTARLALTEESLRKMPQGDWQIFFAGYFSPANAIALAAVERRRWFSCNCLEIELRASLGFAKRFRDEMTSMFLIEEWEEASE